MCISQNVKRRPLPLVSPLKNHILSSSIVEKTIQPQVVESFWHKEPVEPRASSSTPSATTTTTATTTPSTSSSSLSTAASLSNTNTCTVEIAPKQQNPHHVVKHNYHDHANDIDTNKDVREKTKPVARGGVTTPFPVKLHEMLDKIEADGYASVVSWQSHGRCFVVHKPKEFVDHVMPTYFKQSKFASFQRQLNLYGFIRLTKGEDKGGYYHESFLRNKLFLAHKIQRMKVKGTGVRARSNPETEPNFYQMPPCLASPLSKSASAAATSTKAAAIPAAAPSSSAVIVPKAEADETDTKQPATIKSSGSPLAPPPQIPTMQTLKPVPIKHEDVVPEPASSDVSSDSEQDSTAKEEDDNDEDHYKRCSLDDDDDIMEFEGKQFHYLDPLAKASTASQIAISPRPPEVASSSTPSMAAATSVAAVPAFVPPPTSISKVPMKLSSDMSDFDDDPFSKDEMEDFLSDLNLPKSLYNDIMDTVDDDTAFGYLLERIIE